MSNTEPEQWESKFGRSLRAIAVWGAILAAGSQACLVLLFFYHSGMAPWLEIAKQHFLATVGLTGFAIVSFAIVVFLRNSEGPMEFSVWGLKFKGASGQVVVWAFCVIVLSACAKVMW